ncbi:sulfatase [Roseibacillus ishigakijimensis]|uniref:Sulfatase n=1 Tax=Roseibacillus ishigakijimensis TaxID=454146 RepID=A0A934RLG6_9BACT|nr:sulfatase [Roseibacillus ishigakijimensis]MBK1832945.1 sulfatase [Roseibacillus ishigakijimensis]
MIKRFLFLLTTSGLLAAERPNVLLLCIDDLRPELASFGADYIQSPHIDALAARGRAFTRHYVQAPTCGASRYTLLTGRYGPYGNRSLFERGKKIAAGEEVSPSLPAWFREHGYTTVSVGKVSHHPGGRGGPDWDTEEEKEMPLSWDRHLMPTGPWQHPRGAMHGLANGEIRSQVHKGSMDVYQAFDGPDTSYPDGLILEESRKQLADLTDQDEPFFLAVGFIRPHLPFGAPAKYYEPYREAELPPTPHPEKPDWRSTWHDSGEFRGQYTTWGREPNEDAELALELRKHYAACVTYVDSMVGELLTQLEESPAGKNTIVVLWGDHGWHLGEHAIWGKHALFEESLRSPLIISHPDLTQPGKKTRALSETIDIYPTLCDLAGIAQPETLHGRSLRPQLEDPAASGQPALSYKHDVHSLRTDRYRLVLHEDGYAELYDERDREAKNIAADHPEVVNELSAKLHARLKDKPRSRE